MTRNTRRVLTAAAVVLLLAAGVAAVVAHARRAGLTVHGLGDGTVVTAADFGRTEVSTGDPDLLDDVVVLLDGMPIRHQRADGRISLRGLELPDGRHRLLVRAPSPVPLLPDDLEERRFTVDSTPPSLSVEPVRAASPRGPFTVRGTAEGAISVLVGERRVPVDEGRFEVTLPSAPAVLRVAAGDVAGNTAWKEVEVRAGDADPPLWSVSYR